MCFQHLYFEIGLVFRVAASVCCGALLSVSVQAADPDPEAAARAMIAKYVATWDVGAFLAEPAVRRELHALLGADLERLERNLAVNGGIEYVGGALMLMGNAPHRGTEHEAVVCVQPWGGTPTVHAGTYSEGEIALYTREQRYEYLTTCIKDWVTLVTSRHVDRLTRPANVRLISPR